LGLFVATNLPDALSLRGIYASYSNIVPSWITLGMLKAFYIAAFIFQLSIFQPFNMMKHAVCQMIAKCRKRLLGACVRINVPVICL
jgi:hypothetical protein